MLVSIYIPYSICLFRDIQYTYFRLFSVEVIDPAQPIFVVDGLVDCNEEGEGRRKLHPAAQLLVAPMEAAEPLSQVPPACTLKSILQQLGLVGLVP